jgi:spermidine dehydrogenase
VSPLDALAQDLLDPAALPPDYYPPTSQGMRGSHEGSFEVAHEARDGRTWNAVDAGDPSYDLVVVGGGLSGLSAAHFYRKQAGPDARILVIENHDDFGGHAKRNEFWHDDRMQLINGGTLNVEAPSQYSTIAAGLLWDLGVDRERYFEKNGEMWSRYRDMGLRRGMFFDEETFGEDRLVVGYGDLPIGDLMRQAPVSDEVMLDALRLYEEKKDYLPGLNAAEKRQTLTKMSYRDFVINIVGCHPDVMHLFDTTQLGYFVTAMDAVPAIFCRDMGYPGFDGMQIGDLPPNLLAGEAGGAHGRENQARADAGDPDMYFPDGNATIARLLVRSLIPESADGTTMEDIVTARMRYDQLDRDSSKVRIRLNSTVIDVANTGADAVETTYVVGGDAYKVRSKDVVLACWNTVIPHICREVSPEQGQALAYGSKSPLVYTGVMLSNWQSWVDAGVSSVRAPGGFHPSIGLPPSLEMGDYQTSRDPAEPIVVRMSTYFYEPGHSRREQHRIGRNRMLATPFSTFEHHIRDQLSRILGPTGFDDERDILGIAVNRWPHGYAYSYNPLFDPEEWAYSTTVERPCVIGRQRIGRIAIANSDAAGSSHTDAAINEAYRAVNELLEA